MPRSPQRYETRRRRWKTGLFDDAVGNGWAVLSHVADPQDVLDDEQLAFLNDVGARLARVAPEGSSVDGAVVDLEGAYADWFEESGVEAVVVRPDFYVYGTTRTMEELPQIVSSLRSALLDDAAPEPSHQARGRE